MLWVRIINHTRGKKLKSLKDAKWRKDEWRMMNDEWWMKNDEWRIMKDEWRMMKDEWRMVMDEWWRMMISSCWGVLVLDGVSDICECRVVFAIEKKICFVNCLVTSEQNWILFYHCEFITSNNYNNKPVSMMFRICLVTASWYQERQNWNIGWSSGKQWTRCFLAVIKSSSIIILNQDITKGNA